MNRQYVKQEVGPDQILFWFEENGVRICFTEVPGNRHYEEYLEWVAEGNEPEVIEAPVPEPSE